jgi:pimeloyl-ACP methyl ester carboxylesterase
MALQLETMEPREMLSGLTPALKTETNLDARRVLAVAVHTATMHDVDHTKRTFTIPMSGVQQGRATSKLSPSVTSAPTVSFVPFAQRDGQVVKLQVLDWGGTGPTMLLLAGGGDNAHVYDEFAPEFTDHFHVIGITRRGFGKSSQPDWGYGIAERAHDDIEVLNYLGIQQAVFVGHSIAGTELSEIDTVYPDRVTALVYLDCYDKKYLAYGAAHPRPQAVPKRTPADEKSLESLEAYNTLVQGYQVPIEDLRENVIVNNKTGEVVDSVSPPKILDAIIKGLKPAHYDEIKAPTLGIFNLITPQWREPFYASLSDKQKAAFARWVTGNYRQQLIAIQQFRVGIKNSQVIEIPNTTHYIFISDKEQVVQDMLKFLDKPGIE